MKHIIHKAYWNYEKEEQWINEMADRGFALTDYSWMRYVFEDEEPGKYYYRIQLLPNKYNHPESIAYLDFLRDLGIEHVTSYMRWVYLRKSTKDGAFELYTDLDSKIRYLRTISTFWLILMIAEFGAGISNLILYISQSVPGVSMSSIHLILGILTSLLGILFMCIRRPIATKVKALKKEQLAHE